MSEVMTAADIAAQGGPVPGGGPNAVPAAAPAAPAAPEPTVPPVQVPAAPAAPAVPQVTVPPVAPQPDAAELAAEVARLKAAEEKRKVDDQRQTLFNTISGTPTGTQADFDAFSSWAAGGGLTAQEVTVLNETLRTGTPEAQAVLVGTFVQRKNAAAPAMVVGSTPGAPPANPVNSYISKADYQMEMRGEKYKTDSTYREHMKARRKASIAEEERLGLR